ncbi:phosphoglycerate dehydrogenase [Oenococcus kitaharae]|uniref:D-3-phosphoglycerate dehydrogenase n=1 Tax=Oenococcus kitaharae DSM 17330 TaxID=1045004 RepID=G9WHM6_9LACO|nr:phosphoglycerate dehydrogenase [Oenococcus kitaharae]EHN58365.1 D-3-phosphoglycerate dehydrogenase [Oenococcus kitaharae DSM 17330]MCV3296392.1 phosphoglycerate dehydrogenase [Oenococcus kitaharae]OEY81470.1 3-phosphoglycerate dehydrogenase [Oenococcus kitaharae]OEY82958.1 3-phosphoglycerate dehydrogenase [Oenococcus kitaharae]OEY84498.1 3-phosphoglycerate dehydrogenase [Oenococcus kitaharae]
MKVVVPKNLSQAGKDYLLTHHFDLITVPDDRQETILKYGQDANGIILMTDPFDNETLKQFPNLKIIARHGVGFDNVDPTFAAKQGVVVTITPTANAATVAETTLAEIFDLSKNLTRVSHEMRLGNFAYKTTHMGFDLNGKTLGVMGYGRIGRIVAQKAEALGMKVLIFDPFIKDSQVGKLVDRDSLISQADIITLHLVVNEQTTHSFGKREFSLMKKTASLVNLGRGALIDETALIKALAEHQIRAAALDVFDAEPLPLSSAFYQLDNVLLTPHIASNTKECMERMAVDSASEVVRVLSGKKAKWAVNQVE